MRHKSKAASMCLTALVAMFAIGISGQEFSGRAGDTQNSRPQSANSSQLASLKLGSLKQPSSRPAPALDYGKIRLSFEPNVGQANPEVAYLAHGKGYALYLTSQDAVFALAARSREGKNKTAADIVRMKLLGSNRTAELTGDGIRTGISNYFIGNDSKKWRTNIPNYDSVSARGVYPGVDLVYYGKQRELEYDFKVAPHADPHAIQMAFEGAKNLKIDSDGSLVAAVGENSLRLRAPVSYQIANNQKQPVATKYVLQGDGSVSLQIGNYDDARELVIDPILAYSTYLGGSNIDGANAIAVALDRTAFITGGTFSADFPTAHPLQPNVGGPHDFPQDAFVAKISADGSTILYSTYLGGSGPDTGNGIAVDNAGNAYVTGSTVSVDFPTFNAINGLCGGDGACGANWNQQSVVNVKIVVGNAFVTKLNPAGSALIYSTYLGEYENVVGRAIAVDNNQIAYVTGETGPNLTPTVVITPPAVGPPPFPITGTAFQTAYGGGATDAFLTVLSATGTSVLYSSYYGGIGEEDGLGIATDGSANAYITGLTYSPDLPTTANALQTTYGTEGDAFVAKINTNANGLASLAYSTYFGGSGLDQGNGIAVDASGMAYVAGGTQSGGLAPSPRAYGNEGDAFLAKFNPAAGSGPASLVYFTYLGGGFADTAYGVAVDPLGNAYIAGSTVSTDFPTTGAVFQPSYGGGNADAFVAKFDPTGTTLLYSSFLGGTNTDTAYGIAVDAQGSAYVAGQTCSLDFPLANPAQEAPGGNCDAFVSKVTILSGIMVNPAGLVFPPSSLGSTSQPEVVTITNGDAIQSITGISIGGLDPGDFAETTTCGATLNPGQQCPITVTFTPTAIGTRTASLSIVSSAPGSPLIVNLSGTTSSLTLSPTNLTFANQDDGVASVPMTVTATNNGTSAITFSSAVASGDYSETDNCTKAPLQPGTNCTFNVTFTPTGTGSSIGALTISDNAPGSPQIIFLKGTGVANNPDFSLTMTPPSATVNAGQSATFALNVTSLAGFTQAIGLNCTGSIPAGSCNLSQSTVTPAADGTTSVTVTVGTGVRAFVPPVLNFRTAPPSNTPNFNMRIFVPWMVIAIAFAIFGAMRKKRGVALLGLCVATLALMSACNGGSAAGTPAGTPVGTYQITVTGTSGAITHSAIVNVQVN